MDNGKYTCLLPVYKNDRADWLEIAIESMLHQTLSPEEVLIAVDGEIGDELSSVLESYHMASPEIFTVCKFPENEGLGRLLRKAVPLCRNEYIARMDADDYSLPERVEKQFQVLRDFPKVDVVGCNVDEFTENIDIICSKVILPQTPAQAFLFARRRCPVRHPTLLYRKSDVLMAGNYSDNSLLTEDYELITRLMQNGLNVYNIQHPYVRMRIGNGLHKRRGGILYAKYIFRLKAGLHKRRFINLWDFIVSFGGHLLVILMPNSLRTKFYQTFLRRKV